MRFAAPVLEALKLNKRNEQGHVLEVNTPYVTDLQYGGRKL